MSALKGFVGLNIIHFPCITQLFEKVQISALTVDIHNLISYYRIYSLTCFGSAEPSPEAISYKVKNMFSQVMTEPS
jgi:hypothetical protein